jgi:hypothetical protein
MSALAPLLPFQVHSLVVLKAAIDVGLGAAAAFPDAQFCGFKSHKG